MLSSCNPSPSLAAAARALVTLALLAASAAAAGEPPDGTTLDGNFGGFNLDASATDVVTSAAVGPDGKLVIAGYASDGPATWRMGIRRWLANGLPDTSFGNGGGVANPLGVAANTWANAVAVLDNGKILLAGTYDWGGGNTDFVVVRLTASGALDPTFGSGAGFRFVPFNIGDDLTDEANALAFDRSGRILVAGSADFGPGDRDFAIARLTPDGQLDPAFDGDGKRTVYFDYSGPDLDLAFGVAVSSVGKIVLAGASRYTPFGGSPSFNFALAQLNADGSLDDGFGSNGRQVASFDHGGTLADIVRAMAVDDAGRVVVGGDVAWAPAETVWAVARFLPSGAPDLGFNGSGFRFDTFSCPPEGCVARRDGIRALALQGDGKIVVAGAGYVSASANTDHGIARLLANGALDSDFSGDGRALFDWDHGPGGDDDDVAEAVVVGPEGRIYLAGTIEEDFPDMNWGWVELANHYVFADGFERGDRFDW